MKRSREVEEETDSDCSSPARSPKSSISPPDERDFPVAKVIELDPSHQVPIEGGFVMKCSLPGHPEGLAFATYEEYQSHYQKEHTNRCLECRKNLPSAHLLAVHIEECHDSFVAVKREKGEHTFSCFVEGCERKCLTPQKRRLHLIDKHMYPKNYFFAVTRDGIDGRRSLLTDGHRRRRSSTSNFNNAKDARRRSTQPEASSSKGKEADKSGEGKEIGSPARARKTSSATDRPDTEMEDLSGAMSALQFTPSSIRFGRGGGKAGFARR